MRETGRENSLIGCVKLVAHGAILAMALSLQAGSAVAQTDAPFDSPFHKKVVDLGPSPNYPNGNVRVQLSCSYYFRYMVKQLDSGQKGADWLSIVPAKEGTTPECTRSKANGERQIDDGVSGYFLGARKNLVFFRAADGVNGGMPFVIYDSRSRTKIFQDSAYDATMWNTKAEDSPFLRISIAPDGQVFLKYLRVVAAGCDLHKEKASCWKQAQKKFDLKTTQSPICTGYKDVKSATNSALAYPVETSLFVRPSTKTIDGPVKCWPLD
jgi:hypothetical protein